VAGGGKQRLPAAENYRSQLFRYRKKLQKEIVLVFQRLAKGGVGTPVADLSDDRFLFDEQTCIGKQLELHPQHIPGPEGAVCRAEQIKPHPGMGEIP
jgi:hypothetical protein